MSAQALDYFPFEEAYAILAGVSPLTVRMIYRTFEDTARTWWHYQDLRRDGSDEAAARLEAASIKSSLQTFAEALDYADSRLVLYRNGGFVFYFGDGCFIRGYHDGGDYHEACNLLGIKVLNTNTERA